MAYERLESEHVVHTVERLEERIAARFPDRHLVRLAGELGRLISESAGTNERLLRRLAWTRALSRMLAVVVVAVAVVVFVWAIHSGGGKNLDGPTWLETVNNGINDLVFAAIAVFFLYSIPERLMRSRALRTLHRLRSLAHIIDMHQLVKDPERLRDGYVRTSASVDMDLGPEELVIYLEYCSELLSLVGKSAALCAEDSQDAVVLDTTSDIESLTVNLSRKIWQKISAVNEIR
ncbi:MAG: hypothetical protein J2O46_02060 [Nocardioides sp.]|nr:hypothetical protein [Nocardioides sp.]